MSQLFLNNFQTQFIANVKAAPETGSPSTELDFGILRVSDGAAGALLNPGAGHWYVLTAYKRSGTLEHSHEMMRVTSVVNSVVGECRLSVARGQEGTAPRNYVAGDMLELRLTAGAMSEYAQATDPRMTNARSPSGPASGVLSGVYPNPGFAQAMATAADLGTKVDKVGGKGLSANDFDNSAAAKLAGIAEQATKNTTDSQLRDRSTHTGTQSIASITSLQATLDGKVAVVAGKALSTEDYTTAEKSKLAGVSAGASVNATDAQLRDRSTHTGTQAIASVDQLQATLDSKVRTADASAYGLNLLKTASADTARGLLYAPGRGGEGAGGDWPINITGQAGYAVNSNSASTAWLSARINATSTGADYGVLVRNNGGAGDGALAAIALHCDGYATRIHLRPDGYLGIGGWSRPAWTWYQDPAGNMVASGNVCAYSDPRLKRGFKRVRDPFKILDKLDGGTFYWRKGIKHIAIKAGKRDYGILADQVSEVMPEIVTESIEIDGVSYKTVCYEKIVPVLVEGARFLNERRALTEQRLDALEQGLHNVRSMLERLERLVGKAGKP